MVIEQCRNLLQIILQKQNNKKLGVIYNYPMRQGEEFFIKFVFEACITKLIEIKLSNNIC